MLVLDSKPVMDNNLLMLVFIIESFYGGICAFRVDDTVLSVISIEAYKSSLNKGI